MKIHRRPARVLAWLACALLLAPAAASATTVKKQLNIVDLLQESELIVRGRAWLCSCSYPSPHLRSPSPR